MEPHSGLQDNRRFQSSGLQDRCPVAMYIPNGKRGLSYEHMEESMKIPRLLLITATAGLLSLIMVTGCRDKQPEQQSNESAVRDSIPVSRVNLQPVSSNDLLAHIDTSGAKATLVNVWATWCQPCREEFPDLIRIHDEMKEFGVDVVLVSADFPEQSQAAKAFLAKYGVDFQTYLKDEKDMEFINSLNPEWSGALPATFIYDRQGNLRTFWQGKAEFERFKTALTDVLNS